jgi:eukaryotic-like serine/threonine-protein kinase
VLGNENPDTLDTKEALGVVFRIQGRYAEAEPVLTEILGIRRRTQGENNPDTLFAMGNVGLLYRDEGRYAKAEAMYINELEVRQRTLGAQHPTTTPLLVMLGEVMIDQKRFSDAERSIREALSRYERTIPDEWRRFRAESRVGASLEGQAKYAEAEPLLLEGYAGLLQRRANLTAENHYLPERLGAWIVKLYQDWGKPEKAAEWRKKIWVAGM